MTLVEILVRLVLDFCDAGSEGQLILGAVVVQEIGQLSLLVDFPPLQ